MPGEPRPDPTTPVSYPEPREPQTGPGRGLVKTGNGQGISAIMHHFDTLEPSFDEFFVPGNTSACPSTQNRSSLLREHKPLHTNLSHLF